MNLNGSINTVFLTGTNFSGRSNYLKKHISKPKTYISKYPYGIYIGEIPGNYLSGLAPTVKNEIALHASNKESLLGIHVNDFLERILFKKHYDKNPFSLSGGEQTVLSIISALLMEPQKLAIDITLEQLNKSWRIPFFEMLGIIKGSDLCVKICDNRVDEYENKMFIFSSSDEYGIRNNPTECIFKNISISNSKMRMSASQNLSINKINFNYKGSKTKILENCTYEFEPGLVYHLKGENGAGKSTLSKLLCGVLKATSGNIFIGSNECNTYKYPGKLIGYSFQNPDEQLFSSSVRKELLSCKKGTNKDNFDFFIESFGLAEILEKHPAELPFVIRKRLAIVATLINEREWYILDEPTIGQDNFNMAEIANLVKLLVRNGKGIILISHSESFIKCFDKVYTVTLQNGKIES